MINRGYKKELAAADEARGLWNDYQGCLTDFCPVGALTFNDFRFHKRVWFLDKRPSICDGCSKGCNIEVHSDQNVVERYMPVFNEQVNGHWMCDEGRVSYHTYTDPLRLVTPMLRSQTGAQDLAATTWEFSSQEVSRLLKQSKHPLFIIGTDASSEEASAILAVAQKMSGAEVVYFNGVGGVQSSQDDQKLDHLLRMKDKTPNTRGLEQLGLKALNQSQVAAADLVIYLRGGRSKLPVELTNGANTPWILWGVWNHQELKQLTPKLKVAAVLPGLSTLEKSGSFVNESNLKQSFTPAINPVGHAWPVDKVIEGWKL
jgi:NADH-quinone oxidoreductase subunit G